MPLSRVWYDTLVDDSGSGLDGTPWNKAAVDALMDAIDARVQDWIDVPFSAANFSGNGSTWTVEAGDVILNRYCRLGNVLVWSVQLAATSMGGTLNPLVIINPPIPGVSFVTTGNFAACILPAGAQASPVNPGAFQVQYPGAANWPASTNGMYVYFTWIGQVTG